MMAMGRSPIPLIVGAPRSGTTLLRLMLDAHPDLAIPPETGFLPAAAALTGNEDELRHGLVDLLTHFPPDAPAWPDFGLDAADVAQNLTAIRPFAAAEGVRAFYRLYAARFGKTRFGDKTPSHGLALPAIAALLPEVAVIHLIRDGRDVAVSLRAQWFAPGRDAETLALHWRDWVEETRNGGRRCPLYLELRFEDLVTHPEAELRRIAAFIGISFHPAMLDHARGAKDRLAEHGERLAADGRVTVSREQRLRQQSHSALAPDPTRIGIWRQTLDHAEIARFHAVAGELLVELGYGLA
jgi:hypothetical protein